MMTKTSLVEFVSDAIFFFGNSTKWPFSFRGFLELCYLVLSNSRRPQSFNSKEILTAIFCLHFRLSLSGSAWIGQESLMLVISIHLGQSSWDGCCA